ncbi:polyphosphate kinase 1 [Parapedobacter koreensis]|uniref:Polyphosphate kinase n=1 Tax=Parapedobacter koreensis TaxID=332977 RepID=A0A1H7FE70_9SPHI|nr:polyphosphate kinase 1 [Parapedobacter koreensis]SEK21545.1 polyphosphate kinase [Parapedobacter koreensis]
MIPKYIHRDLSWLRFNGRVLDEAARGYVPLLERLKFMGIFSSNLDEFYRVRIPVLTALKKLGKQQQDDDFLLDNANVLKAAKHIIRQQQEGFGQLLQQQVLPKLAAEGIKLWYNEPIPTMLVPEAKHYFFSAIATFLEIDRLGQHADFFPLNNRLYFVVFMKGESDMRIVSIPSHRMPRFYTRQKNGVKHVLFIDDIIRQEIPPLFGAERVEGIFSFKITRDADIPIDDGFGDDMADRIERQIRKRDFGLATRLLYQPGIPKAGLARLMEAFSLHKENRTKGGPYHNLKDLMDFPVKQLDLMYPPQSPAVVVPTGNRSLYDEIRHRDVLVSTPYESFDAVVRFFNEAAIDAMVLEIKTTIYRVAADSRILHALMTAAKNGKSVTVFVELKARFDEENNIKWAKRLQEAGINIIYSIPGLKVHAKVALVKKNAEVPYFLGLLATGNLNENTAKVYADHFLMTANQALLAELGLLFDFLQLRRKPREEDLVQLKLNHLLISQFNLKAHFMHLIDAEIANIAQGLPASITIKLNNLEEEELIDKLYEASQAGVPITLIIRGICRLRPGVPGLSERITVKRIVGRYLEHARIFIFGNGGQEFIYMGSADWMNRSVRHRIEVCFPIYDDEVCQMVRRIVELQCADGISAVLVDENGLNRPVANSNRLQAQLAVEDFFCEKLLETR